MKNLKLLAILVLAMFSISFAFAAYLGTPTAADKAYFKSSLKNITEREFRSIGVAFGSSDLQASVYVYKRQTLTSDGWTAAYSAAFATNPSNWEQAYDYVIGIVKQSDLYETYGYLDINNQSYWLANMSISNTSFYADITLPNSTENSGNVSLSPLFWSFWTGSADVEGNSYRMVLLKLKN